MSGTERGTDTSALLAGVARYYTGKLEAHGPTPQGADWNSAESQALRFDQLLRICDGGRPFSINDYGCGYGALVDHMQVRGLSFRYRGLDISAAMIDKALELHRDLPQCEFVTDEAGLAAADYTVASGILNVKLEAADEAWQAYLLQTLDRMAALSTNGFAFNALSSYSDPERRRADLYYADPLALFDHCKRRFSRSVAVLHDYALWEFTILVRL